MLVVVVGQQQQQEEEEETGESFHLQRLAAARSGSALKAPFSHSQNRGVTRNKRRKGKSWLSRISHRGPVKHLDYHATEEDAARAFDMEGARRGRSRLNFSHAQHCKNMLEQMWEVPALERTEKPLGTCTLWDRVPDDISWSPSFSNSLSHPSASSPSSSSSSSSSSSLSLYSSLPWQSIKRIKAKKLACEYCVHHLIHNDNSLLDGMDRNNEKYNEDESSDRCDGRRTPNGYVVKCPICTLNVLIT